MEGELARGLVLVGDCGFGDILAGTAVCPLLIYRLGTNKACELKVRGAGERTHTNLLNVTSGISM